MATDRPDSFKADGESLVQSTPAVSRQAGGASSASATTMSAARLTVAAKRARAEAGSSASLLMAEPIAIVGMACRFPGGADTPDAFWKLLEEGRSGIRNISEVRWPSTREALPAHLRLGGYLEDVDLFDPEFFGIAPREAHSIDPQQRLLLEVSWEALLDAGMPPSSLGGTDTGVFVAVYNTDYFRMQMREGAAFDAYTGVGAAHSVAAGRISFLLNLRGPCLAIDTACSSSLVATQLACQSLRQRECSVALVGGSSLKLLSDEVRIFAEWGMLSSDGRAKTFDAAADGFVPGEGCAVMVLKRLSDAIAQGDPIRAVIRGGAVNHDGRSSVLTAPNGPAQEAVLRAALRDAHLQASDVSFIETHGTGTSLGDPIEVGALDAVYGSPALNSIPGIPFCLLGAVKTNIGHLEASAGIAGLIKVVLALEHEAIPPNLNFSRLNQQIQLEPNSRLQLANDRKPWPRGAQSRFAGVSSFGLGGTNAHILLEEAPLLPRMPELPNTTAAPVFCLPVSAHSFAGLQRMVGAYVDLLRQPGAHLKQIVSAAARTRDHDVFRIAVVGSSATEVADQLESRLAGLTPGACENQDGRGKLAFLFSGQGSLWDGVLASLADYPEAEKVFALCEAFVETSAGWSLRQAAASASALEDTARSQPILFVVQLALLKILEGWGIVPEAVTGHSVGEIAAAVAAGVLSLEQGLSLALKRGASMAADGTDDDQPGRMLGANMSVADAEVLLQVLGSPGQPVEIAAINAPQFVVFSGPESSVQLLADALKSRQINTHRLDVRYAFHSAAMATAAQSLRHDLESEYPAGQLLRPRISLVSTVTGQPWRAGDGDAAYWGRGIRQPVRFQEAVEQLGRLGCRTLLEVGPHPVLLRSATATLAEASPRIAGEVVTIASMRRGQSARATLLAAAAQLYEAGYDLKWERIYTGALFRTTLPTYPWVRERYWLPSLPIRSVTESRNLGLLGEEIVSPFVEGRLWQISLDIQDFPWLAEHSWHGKPIVPFAAWLEIARRAAVAIAADSKVSICEFAVHQPLTLGQDPVTLQVLASPTRELKLAAQVDGRWETFATGFWETGMSAPQAPHARQPESAETEAISPEVLYRELEVNGLTYGPAFRLLRSVRRNGAVAWGDVAADSGAKSMNQAGLPPTLLDACLQTLQAVQSAEYQNRAVLPLSVGRYRVLGSANELVAVVRMQSSSDVDAIADMFINDREGTPVAEIRALRVRRAPAFTPLAPRWQVAWMSIEDRAIDSASKEHAVWVLPGGEGASTHLFAELGKALEEQNVVVKRTSLDSLSKEISSDPVNLLLAGDTASVIAHFLSTVTRERLEPGGIERVCLVTRGAQAVFAGESTDPLQAGLLGLARTFRAEYPAISVFLLDLPLSCPAAVTFASGRTSTVTGQDGISSLEAKSIAAWLRSSPGRQSEHSQELAFRHGRFCQSRLQSGSTPQEIESELVIQKPGLLETLDSVPCSLPDPAPGEVQIASSAHGLNFRDVLTALGSYPGTAAPLGAECSGMVIKAGPGVTLLAGTPILAFAPASLRSRVNLPVEYVVAKPPAMSFADAATIPVAFLTAHYAFSRLAILQPGQTVLIHSAAGGLGQAAVQLARQSGATVIATAGSASKRAILASQGICHVFDSRSVGFAEDVLRVTQGQGVDVVLNALSGDKIGAGFRALRQGGAFVEIGKRDIWTTEQVAQVRPDARYWAFDLGEVATKNPALVTAMFEELLPLFVMKKLTPLPHEIYSIAHAEEAFRFMASGRHVGKLVLMREPQPLSADDWLSALHHGTVLITGGTGALGVATARWLMDQGARSLVLLSRKGTSEPALALQGEATTRGASILLERGDVANRSELAELLRRIRGDVRYPLRIVLHAAGEVDDRLLADQTAEAFQAAMRTKVGGATLLEELTAADDLAVTVYYSSVAALLGSAGQASYASANAYLDGLARQRSGRGLRTLSVHWGAWADGGMVEQLSSAALSRMHRQGVRPMRPASALAAFKNAVLEGQPVATIADIEWQKYLEQFPASATRDFFSTFLPLAPSSAMKPEGHGANKTDTSSAVEEITAILAATRTERGPRMEALVRALARKVLGLSAGRPMPADTPLQEMGLDSLMALELRNVLSQALSRPLSATLLFDYPTIRGLAQHLLLRVFPEASPVDPFREQVDLREAALTEDDLSSMSDAEAEELLLAELDREGRR